MPKIEEIEALAKRRGFFWPSSEIYGTTAGFYDYGPLGAAMKRKFQDLWRKYFLSLGDNFHEIETTNVMPEKVFIASGHVTNFIDPTVKCKKCGTAHRADHIIEDYLGRSFEGITAEDLTKLIKEKDIKCSKCKGPLAEVGVFNLMFPLAIGAEGETKGYLRGETAQGAYVSFLRSFGALREKLPLGLLIVGRAYRNEISPRQLLIRQREFTQAELQIFFDPDKINEHEKFDDVKDYKLALLSAKNREAGKEKEEIKCADAVGKLKLPKMYVYYMAKIQQFYFDKLKIPKEKFRFRELSEEERAFYNRIHWDMEIQFDSIGWKEVGGIHYRGDHDLSGHAKISKKSQEVFFENKKLLPHVLELSFGVDRAILVLLDLGIYQREGKNILKLPAAVAPYIAGIYPLVNKDGIDAKAREIYEKLKADGFDVIYDDSGSIGRRYARSDEAGVPLGITVDYDSLKNNDVTIRNRDTTKQERVGIKDIASKLQELQHL